MIRVEDTGTAGRVCLLTLDRQERSNALDTEHWRTLAGLVRDAPARGARVIVVTGAGKVFCAGADLNSTGVEIAQALEASFAVIRACPLPVIAHVNGAAVGAGAQLAVSCDLRVAGPHGRFRVPAAAISLPVHPGTIRRFVALAGAGAARALLLGCDGIAAERAHALGLVDRIGDLDAAIAWASEIAGYAPLVLQYLKEQLQIADPPESAGYGQALENILRSDDYAEAVRARKEGRPPDFHGQ